jgi:adenylate kinase
MKPNVILIGAPGSGKGTQSEELIKNYSYLHVSTGNLLRDEIEKSTELGKRVSSVLASGNLVDDKTVLELLSSKCDLLKNYYIFDGFPRNIEQAVLLDSLISGCSSGQIAIYLKIDVAVVVKRISRRRVCSKCGYVYSLDSENEKTLASCFKCGEKGSVLQRKDDMPDVVENRLKIFLNSIQPMLDYYGDKNILHIVDASKAIPVVFEEISSLIDNFKINK